MCRSRWMDTWPCYRDIPSLLLNAAVNLIVVGLARPRLNPITYRSLGENTNNYITEAVDIFCFKKVTIDTCTEMLELFVNHRIVS